MGPVIFSYILSLRQPSGTWGYVPNRTESRKKQRASGEEGAEKWRRKGCTSRQTGLQQAWQPCLGSSRTHTPWETPRRLGTETFSNSLAVQKSLSASQACLCHYLGAFCSEQPVLGLHFKASTEGSNSRLLWLSLPWDDPAEFQGSLGQGTISGPRIRVHVWSLRNTQGTSQGFILHHPWDGTDPPSSHVYCGK